MILGGRRFCGIVRQFAEQWDALGSCTRQGTDLPGRLVVSILRIVRTEAA